MTKGVPDRLRRFLELLVERNANDLHLKADVPAAIRLQGRLVRLGDEPVTDEEIEGLFFPILTARQRTYYEEHGSLDVGLTLPTN